jgi:hypothetical protein
MTSDPDWQNDDIALLTTPDGRARLIEWGVELGKTEVYDAMRAGGATDAEIAEQVRVAELLLRGTFRERVEAAWRRAAARQAR